MHPDEEQRNDRTQPVFDLAAILIATLDGIVHAAYSDSEASGRSSGREGVADD